MSDKKISFRELATLFGVFFKIGAVTFGGGYAMLPLLNSELVDKRGWTTNEQLLDYYAIGQSTPGIIAVNVATFIGYNRAGILGGIIATAGVVMPSLIIITLLARFISNFSEIAWVQKALTGINVAVAAMLSKAVWTFTKKSVKNIWSFLILAAAFFAMYFFGIGSVWVIVTSAALGIAMSWLPAQRKNSSNNGEAK